MTRNIALIRGDGIGPEIVGQAKLVLDKIAEVYGHEFVYTDVAMGGNAINIGLPLLECEAAAEEIQAGDEVSVDFDTGVITDHTTQKTYQAEPFPEFIQNIIKKGGLLASLKEM